MRKSPQAERLAFYLQYPQVASLSRKLFKYKIKILQLDSRRHEVQPPDSEQALPFPL